LNIISSTSFSSTERASRAASGFENGLRQELKSILNTPSKSRAFSKPELALIERARAGGKLENSARLLGKFGISLDLSSGGLLAGMTALGGLLSGTSAGAIGSGAFIALASGAKQLARVLTQRNADLAAAVVRSGNNGRRIVADYLKAVPKTSRSTEQLAGLLLSQKVPQQQLANIRTNRNPLIANAAYVASVLSAIEDEVPEPTQEQQAPQ